MAVHLPAAPPPGLQRAEWRSAPPTRSNITPRLACTQRTLWERWRLFRQGRWRRQGASWRRCGNIAGHSSQSKRARLQNKVINETSALGIKEEVKESKIWIGVGFIQWFQQIIILTGHCPTGLACTQCYSLALCFFDSCYVQPHQWSNKSLRIGGTVGTFRILNRRGRKVILTSAVFYYKI